jgi:hypothetical protein
MLFKFVDCIFWFFIYIAYCLRGKGEGQKNIQNVVLITKGHQICKYVHILGP